MIVAQNLVKRFGKVPAVDGVSFEVGRGESFALLGPNGSGKSTTLKCMVGLATPDAGTVRIGNFDLARQPRQARALISYLPQRVAFHENLTAREVLQFYCRLRKLPAERIEQVLHGSRFNFNGFADKQVSEFSGGMVQRLGITVAFLADTPVLVLDEPTTSLDPEGAIRFRHFLGQLKQEGKTIVFSSHLLAEVELLADRVAVLSGGKLVAVESVEALRRSLLARARIRLALANLEERFARAALEAGAIEARIEDGALLVASMPERRLAILRAVENAGARVLRFSTEEPGLEEVYLRYVGGESSGHRGYTGADADGLREARS